jgi:DNA-directed RNA polymerases I, II, and III subunit RPABC2
MKRMKLKVKQPPVPEPTYEDDDDSEEEDEDEEEEEEGVEDEEGVEGDEEGGEGVEGDEEGVEGDEAVEQPVETSYVNTGGLGDDTELIDLIIDQNETSRRTYTDINVTAMTLKNYNTYPYLTKYEKARVLGVRAEQLGRNAPILINSDQVNKGRSDHEIAWQEVLAGRCPWIIARPLPNGTRLLISVNLLKIL